MKNLLLICFVSIIPLVGLAEEKKKEEDLSLLTLERIYDGSDFNTKGYSVKWTADGDHYTKLDDSDDGQKIVSIDAASGKEEVLVPSRLLIPPGASKPIPVESYTFSDDLSLVLIYTNSKRVWRRNSRGDYWILDRGSRQLKQLGGNAFPSTLMFAKISPASSHVAYVIERDIYVENLSNHQIVRQTTATNEDIINGTFDWVYEEEFGIRDGFRWSPDGTTIAFWQIDTAGVPRFPLVNNTDSLYPEIKWFTYPKTGQKNPTYKIGVKKIDEQGIRFLDLPNSEDRHYIARLDWAERSDKLIFHQLNRLQNTNRVVIADAFKNQMRDALVETDDAWVNVHDELMFVDGDRFTWLSERGGWRQIFLAGLEDSSIKSVTPNGMDVIELLKVDKANECLYFLASPENATQKYLYRIGLDGSDIKRLSSDDQPGTHTYSISTNAKWAVHSYSRLDEMPIVEMVSLPDHQTVRTLEDNKEPRETFSKLKRTPAEFLQVDIGGGVALDAWCIRPPEFDASKTSEYPLLVFVYGEPAGQTVLDRWGGNRHLWHLLMAQQGYVVMSFDNRGTPAPKGREWRKSVYRQVGVIAPNEQAAAVRAVLKKFPYLNKDRIGVWGWSGGGSMTLNAMFKFPDLYKTGISIAPVPNQRYYDTIYQERYMGLPLDNVDGYVKGSAVNYAHQLKGNLLLVHGTGDDNCHYQTMEMLINELIRHKKQFSMMAYPNRTHAIREGENTTFHLQQLMTDYLKKNL